MADLFWPGDERAGESFSELSFLHAMVEVETAWLQAMAGAGIVPAGARPGPLDPLRADDVADLARAAELSGNPVVPMLDLLRSRADDEVTRRWVHRGLTSQDVLDTAVMLCARGTRGALLGALEPLTGSLVRLAREHRDDLMAGRTLTQHAVPTTFGLKAATWLQGVLDARDRLLALEFPVQLGGAAGTLAAVVELAGDIDAARFLVADTARRLGLPDAVPWHTTRAPVTAYADALVTTSDALGRLANDVLVLGRPEIGELTEATGAGRGGSSTMPHKANPVLSVLVRRAALSAPLLGAQVHLAAAEQVDERADGGWHTEWSALSTLSRRTLAAATQAAELVSGLSVHTARMRATVDRHADDLLAERAGIRTAVGLPERPADPAHYLGAAAAFVDEVLTRAEAR